MPTKRVSNPHTVNKVEAFPGDKFGRLKVIKEAPPVPRVTKDGRANGSERWFECECECGTRKLVRLYHLRSGRVISCGCAVHDALANRNRTHGMSKTVEFKTWQAINKRVSSPDEHLYFGLPIEESWKTDFMSFYAHVGPRPGPTYSIDRIKNEIGYVAGNVKWSDKRQQARNRKTSVFVEYRGQQRLLIEVCEELGLPYASIAARRLRGTPESELFVPIQSNVAGKFKIVTERRVCHDCQSAVWDPSCIYCFGKGKIDVSVMVPDVD